MATIILSGSINDLSTPGGIIHTVAGDYLSQAYIMPALFPTKAQDMSPGRLSEINIQSACEGSPINRCYGSEVRCSGTCIWVSDLIEVKRTEETGGGGKGGGGGGGPEITTYSYFVDIAMTVCQGPAGSIARIWADGKLLYTTENIYTEVRPNGNIVKVGKQMDVVYDSDGILPEFKIGRIVAIGGYGVYEINAGTFILSRMFIDRTNMTHLRFKNPNAANQALIPDQTIINQAAYETPTGKAESITIYLGDQNNVPDPTIEAYKGVGNVPNFNGICYVVLHRLKLTDYGNRIPNFSFLVRESGWLPN